MRGGHGLAVEYRVCTEGRGRTGDESPTLHSHGDGAWKLPAHEPDKPCPPLAGLVRLRRGLRGRCVNAGHGAHRGIRNIGERSEAAEAVGAACAAVGQNGFDSDGTRGIIGSALGFGDGVHERPVTAGPGGPVGCGV